MRRSLTVVILLIVFLSSCTTKKQLTYLQDIDIEKDESLFFEKKTSLYKIQNTDILYIKISSLNEEINHLFNPTSYGSGTASHYMYRDDAGLYLHGYVVNPLGYIELPVIGEIKVSGKTVQEVKEIMEDKVLEYFNEALVTVRLMTFKISVLGEVHRPGSYRNYNDQVTVLEAISLAGDITDYGNRNEVLVLRPTMEGTTAFRIDLTDKALLLSDAFFLKPNDIVIVEPIRSKSFKMNIPNISLLFSGISSLILIINFLKYN